MLLILLFTCLFLLYGGIVFAWSNNSHYLLTSCILLLICLYDWLFISLSYFLPNNIVYILKTYQEVLLLVIVILHVVYIFSVRYCVVDKISKLFFICICIPFVYLFVLSIFFDNSVDMIIKGVKSFYLPIFFAFALYKRRLLHIKFGVWSYIVVLVVGFAFWQVYNFHGSLSELWFYDSYKNLDENPVDVGYYNFLKDGFLRATSFFVTPIDLSVFSAVLVSFFLSKLLYRFSFLTCILLLVGVTGIYLSQTRMGWLIVAICSIIYILNRIKGFLDKRIIFIPCIAIVMTFVTLLLGMTSDLSALGRIMQYVDFISDFIVYGTGIGDQKANFSYDSFFLCSFKMMGVLGILYFAFYLKLVIEMINIYNRKINADYKDVFIVAVSVALIYVFAFHHFAGSLVLTYIYLFIFYFFQRNGLQNSAITILRM